ncbi:MAG: PilZ domain-containing protein [Bradyrhizobium sp.]
MTELPKPRALRYKVAKPGIIKFGERTVDCLVRSLSETGAGMDVVNQLGIPAKFELVIPGDGLSLMCRVAWRRDHKMGVAFIGP